MSGKKTELIEIKFLLWMVLYELHQKTSEETVATIEEECFNIDDMLDYLEGELS
jgi:hypothetical protein